MQAPYACQGVETILPFPRELSEGTAFDQDSWLPHVWWLPTQGPRALSPTEKSLLQAARSLRPRKTGGGLLLRTWDIYRGGRADTHDVETLRAVLRDRGAIGLAEAAATPAVPARHRQ